MKSNLHIEPKLASVQALAAYGALVEPTEDGAIFDSASAQLLLKNGTPRFYFMTLRKREMELSNTNIVDHHSVRLDSSVNLIPS